MYDLQVIIAALTQSKKINPFLMNLFIKGNVPRDRNRFEVHVKKSKRSITPFVGPDLPGVYLGKDKFSIKEFEPPMIKPYRTARANELLQQQFGQNIYGTSVKGITINTMANEVLELDEAITRRENLMLATLLSTGKIPIDGKGVKREAISFGMDPSNIETLTGNDLWTAGATSNPYADMERIQQKILKSTGLLIDSVVMTPKAKAAFMNHPETKDRLKYTEQNVTRINPRGLGDGASYIGTIPELNLDIYSYVDWYTDDTGTDQPMLADGGVLFGKSKSITVHYGAIAQISNGKRGVFVGTRIPKHWVDEDADLEKIRLAASPLPVPDDADGFAFLTVV